MRGREPELRIDIALTGGAIRRPLVIPDRIIGDGKMMALMVWHDCDACVEGLSVCLEAQDADMPR